MKPGFFLAGGRVETTPDFRLATDAVIDRGWVEDCDRQRRKIEGAVSKLEARLLAEIVLRHNCRRCVETGVANGISTLAITQAAAHVGGHHYGIDPCQTDQHRNAALLLLNAHGLADDFTLLAGPTHLEAPRLLAQQEPFDFVFVDGMHTFDYKLLDFFYADKLLRVGGWLVFHDLLLPSVKKVYRFVRLQRRYRAWRTPELVPPFFRRCRFLAGAFLKRKPLWYFWPNRFCNLLVLEKTSDKEQPWSFFEDF